MAYTCSNERFSTNTSKGFPHGMGQPAGSVFPDPIYKNSDGTTLWLEYLDDMHGNGAWNPEPLWLMWYDSSGKPNLMQSAPFDLSGLRDIVGRFIA